ncbi:MAG: DUF1963 domain-containing protein [Actinomycetia bacterium]|nr:DUF1963 domain-containing protein [Actinomycetes bacterium]
MAQMPLPPELERARGVIESTLRPCLLLATDPAGPRQPWSSRIGGAPYLRPREPWPGDEQGAYVFLAQLNYTELPALEGHPRHGLLRFFIGADPDYGLTPGQPPRFRVDYLPEVETAGLETCPPAAAGPSPLEQPGTGHPLVATRAVLPITYEDHRFSDLVGRAAIGPEAVEVYHEVAHLSRDSPFHQLGGYPYFAQSDWRAGHPASADYQLLAQIDSQAGVVSWGEMGVAGFWIRPEHLAACDFSHVIYYWDCT